MGGATRRVDGRGTWNKEVFAIEWRATRRVLDMHDVYVRFISPEKFVH